MGFFQPQNPGIGGLNELTTAEELFIQNLAALTYASGDILYHNGTSLTRLAKGTDGQFLKLVTGLPAWASESGVGTVTTVSVVTANGVSGSVANATTTPAITITLGDITPSSVTVTGLTASLLVATDGDKKLQSLATATYPSLTEISYVKGVTSSIQTQLSGKENYHGIQAIGAVTFDNSTHILSVATVTYWYQGTSYTSAIPVTCDIDSFETLTANTLYTFYFDDATGTLKCSDSAWNLKTQVPVAYVHWNGTAGTINKEWHTYTRDLDWHEWAHDTVGTRYQSGLSLTAPTTVADATLTIESGTIHDEDLEHTISQQTTIRGWYQASLGVYTWAEYALPYLGASGDPYWLDTDDYTLKSVADSKFVCYWVYASNDQDRPIYVIPTQAADPYDTVAQARAETAPSLSGLNISPEMKLIYRFIYRGDGEFQESNDYRFTSPLPSGGTASTTAGAVSFSPTGNISSTTVQTAIEELDSEKAPSTAPTFATSITGSYLTASEILITDADKKIVSAPVATYPSLTELSYVKGLSSAVQTQLGNKAPIASPTFTGEVTIPNTGLHLLDTNASHDLIIKPGSDLTADKTLTITTGDADVNLNLTATTDEYVLAYDVTTNTWRGIAVSGGAGDMVLADVQSVTGLKTFDTTKLAVKGSSTGSTAIASANAGATDYTATLPAVTGTFAFGTGTENEIAYWSGANTLGTLAVATYPSLTELSYVKGVTSAIQTQIGNLVPKSLFDANTILYATSDNTPAALTVTEQTLVGRATGGAIAAIAIDSDLSSVSANDDTVPSAKATKTALDLKAPLASPTFTGTITLADNARFDLTLPTADTYCTGPTTDSFASGYSSAVGDLVFFGSSGKWLEVDADAVATCVGLMGIALEAKSDTQAMKVALPGSMVRLDAWNWTVGAVLYAGETLGAMQEAIPTGANSITKPVAVALSADVIYFFPSPHQSVNVA